MPDADFDDRRSRRDLPGGEHLVSERHAGGLERRLARLPDGHPSGAGYADVRGRPAGPEYRGGEGDRLRPLTDAEYAEHVADVEAKLEQARAVGLATDIQHTIDRGREVWSEERQAIHDELIAYFYAHAPEVPCEYRALLAGGLAGAGKTTVLTQHAGIDLSRYLMINPDVVKEEMARRRLIPEIGGLSAMEVSDLVHEESSYLARRLSQLAQADGRNLVWDVTMSDGDSTARRVVALKSAGYKHVEGVFVDIPIGVSLQRTAARHREGHDNFLAGNGLGGRYVPPRLIFNQADPEWGSKNRKNFEQTKSVFDSWSRYENSTDGKAPGLAEVSPPAHHVEGKQSGWE
jgi:predicted kinase